MAQSETIARVGVSSLRPLAEVAAEVLRPPTDLEMQQFVRIVERIQGGHEPLHRGRTEIRQESPPEVPPFYVPTRM